MEGGKVLVTKEYRDKKSSMAKWEKSQIDLNDSHKRARSQYPQKGYEEHIANKKTKQSPEELLAILKVEEELWNS
jgi:hypothetical protein